MLVLDPNELLDLLFDLIYLLVDLLLDLPLDLPLDLSSLLELESLWPAISAAMKIYLELKRGGQDCRMPTASRQNQKISYAINKLAAQHIKYCNLRLNLQPT
jgi:hypothetical protein